jgi:hypothetical protein
MLFIFIRNISYMPDTKTYFWAENVCLGINCVVAGQVNILIYVSFFIHIFHRTNSKGKSEYVLCQI